MAQNYTTIKAKITAVKEKMEGLAGDSPPYSSGLRAKRAATAAARAEVAQAQAALNSLTEQLANQNRILAPTQADKNAATAKVNQLRARRTELRTRKAGLLTDRDAIDAQIATLNANASTSGSIANAQEAVELADWRVDMNQKIYLILQNDQDTGPNATALTAAVAAGSGPAQPAGSAMSPPVTVTQYTAGGATVEGLAFLLNKRRDKEVEIQAMEEALAALIKRRDANSDPPQELLDEIQERGDAIEVERTNLAAFDAKIVTRRSQISNKSSDITQANQTVAQKIAEKRELQVDLAEARVERQAKTDEIVSVGNELQNIEGQGVAVVGPPARTAEEGVFGTDADDGDTGSQLAVAVLIENSADQSLTDRQTLIDTITGLKTAAESNLTAKRSLQTTAETDENTAKAAYDLAVSQLNGSLEAQKKFEVNAALKVLEAFLKVGATVLASGVNLEASVQTEVDKTFTSSKVRVVLEKVKAAITSPVEYRKLRAEFLADPVGAFFSNVADPDLSDLSVEDVQRFQAEIRASFAPQARALLAQYGASSPVAPGQPAPAGGVSLSTILFVVLIVAAIALAVMYARQ